MDGSTVYWITRLDEIKCLFGFMLGILIVGSICYGIIMASEIDCCTNEEKASEYGCTLKSRLKTSGVISLFICLILTFTPSTKEAAAIYVIPKITSDEAVSEYKDVYKLAKEWMKQSLDIENKKKEGD